MKNKINYKKDSGFFLRNYKQAFNFLAEAKSYVYFGMGVFAFFIILGFIFPSIGEEWALKIIKDLVARTKGFGFFDEFIFIFFNYCLFWVIYSYWDASFALSRQDFCQQSI